MTLKEILKKYERQYEDEGSLPDEDDPSRYVLIEKNRLSGRYWITAFDTPEDAGAYVDTQEYPEDYDCLGLHDTQTGKTLGAVHTTTFSEDADPDYREILDDDDFDEEDDGEESA